MRAYTVGNNYPAAQVETAMSDLGSKAASGAYQAIIAHMPAHDIYIETHLGSGAIMRRKPAACENFGIDLDIKALRKFRSTFECNNISLISSDAVLFLRDFDFSAGRVFVYADPPYLLETRTSNKRYEFEYTNEDHKELLDCLKSLQASVMISGYPSEFYDKELKGWRSYEFQVMTRGGVRTEKIWMNYGPDTVYWSKYAGKNYTDRQRIKRKAERWAKKFHSLPLAERYAILSVMLNS